jgi:hypothetical protein
MNITLTLKWVWKWIPCYAVEWYSFCQ